MDGDALQHFFIRIVAGRTSAVWYVRRFGRSHASCTPPRPAPRTWCHDWHNIINA
jgi:hypothetical protein